MRVTPDWLRKLFILFLLFAVAAGAVDDNEIGQKTTVTAIPAQGLVGESAEKHDERLDPERCQRDVVCTEKDRAGPRICGTNGKTYANPCELNRVVCFGLPVEMHAMGDCPVSERCSLEREFQLKLMRSNSTQFANEFVPICDKKSGLYETVQCHSASGYCWCSTLYGAPIPSTAVAIDEQQLPDCHNAHAIQVKANGQVDRHKTHTANASDCGHVERILFNSNVLDVFRHEYGNDPGEHGPHKGDTPDETEERRILVWRFNKLDLNGDGLLSMEELAPETRLVLLVVKPTACARRFHKHCDLNSDRQLDLDEWVACLRIDFGSSDVLSDADNSLSRYELGSSQNVVPGSDTPKDDEDSSADVPVALSAGLVHRPVKKATTAAVVPEKPSCQGERDKILAQTTAQFLGTVFVPECSEHNERFYAELQCHQKATQRYCWCVHPITGMPMGGDVVRTAADCQNHHSKSKPKIGGIKGCLPQKQKLFYRKLFELLAKEMQSQEASFTLATMTPGGATVAPKRRKVAKWKFAQMDANGNSQLEKAEWNDFRATLRALKHVRKCGRNFLRFCDTNRDNRISRREWMLCTVKAYREAQKVKKPNPFLRLLKPVDE